MSFYAMNRINFLDLRIYSLSFYLKKVNYVIYNRAIGLMSRVFANGAGVQFQVEPYQSLKKW